MLTGLFHERVWHCEHTTFEYEFRNHTSTRGSRKLHTVFRLNDCGRPELLIDSSLCISFGMLQIY